MQLNYVAWHHSTKLRYCKTKITKFWHIDSHSRLLETIIALSTTRVFSSHLAVLIETKGRR